MTILVYIVGIVLIVQLFNLQIVNGKEYRETSNTRLSRETVIKAARGSIKDRTGNLLVTTKMGFNIELYKTKINATTLNKTILNTIKILENNNDKYINNLPIPNRVPHLPKTPNVHNRPLNDSHKHRKNVEKPSHIISCFLV